MQTLPLLPLSLCLWSENRGFGSGDGSVFSLPLHKKRNAKSTKAMAKNHYTRSIWRLSPLLLMKVYTSDVHEEKIICSFVSCENYFQGDTCHTRISASNYTWAYFSLSFSVANPPEPPLHCRAKLINQFVTANGLYSKTSGFVISIHTQMRWPTHGSKANWPSAEYPCQWRFLLQITCISPCDAHCAQVTLGRQVDFCLWCHSWSALIGPCLSMPLYHCATVPLTQQLCCKGFLWGWVQVKMDRDLGREENALCPWCTRYGAKCGVEGKNEIEITAVAQSAQSVEWGCKVAKCKRGHSADCSS